MPPTLTVKQSYEYLNIGRTRMFALLKTKKVKSYKHGKSRRIKREWLLEYERELMRQESGSA
ncbi:excisionase family DNA-binding protein [Paenibacillus koleovorans]|uniref:excisionase family DNA-binding protein n=1 Tax=Paenibacillus koleovorans TaxID=121608 RepID=UPI0035A25B0D